jgi:fluorothreonine transaldolase
MRVATKDGGHFLTELVCRSFGRQSSTYVYKDDMSLDIDRTREVFKRENPSLLYVDAMNYLFPFPLAEIKELAGDVPLVFDASHTLGLIAGGQFQDPLNEGADILQANTHQTLFGPQKGIILGTDRTLMENVGYTLSSGMVGSQHTAPTIALFAALHEMWYDGREYAARVVGNARFLAEQLHTRGVPVLAESRGFTANHMFFVDIGSVGTGPMVLDRLIRANISANRVIAFNRSDTIRFGVQEVTRRGFGHDALTTVADLLAPLILGREEPERIRPRIAELVGQHREIHFTGQEATPREPITRQTSSVPSPTSSSSSVPKRPRWIEVRRSTGATRLPRRLFEQAHALGVVAGAFPHQSDSAGNISCVDADGRQYVTGSGVYIKDLGTGDFVEIKGRDGWALECEGDGPPSAEAYLHRLLREKVGATYVVHNHCILDRDLEEEGEVLVIPPKEYGSVALAEAVADAASKKQVMYVRRHGLVFWATGYEECAELVHQLSRRAGCH